MSQLLRAAWWMALVAVLIGLGSGSSQAAPGDPTISVTGSGGGETGSGAFLNVGLANTAGQPAHTGLSATMTLPDGMRFVASFVSANCALGAPTGFRSRSLDGPIAEFQGDLAATVTNCNEVLAVTADLPGTYEVCAATAVTANVGVEPNTSCRSYTFVDTVAPPPPVITGPGSADTVGPSFSVEGTSEAGSTVVIADSAGTELCRAVATPSGEFTCRVTGRADGPLTLVATATDAGGNSTDGDPVDVIVETPTSPPTDEPTPPADTTGSGESDDGVDDQAVLPDVGSNVSLLALISALAAMVAGVALVRRAQH